MPNLILASSSTYRAMLLKRLRLPFSCHSPDLDEQRLPQETACAMAQRLALRKAERIAQQFPDGLVIGSDQTLALKDEVLGKADSSGAALAQLQQLNGRRATFFTAVAVVSARRQWRQTHYVTTRVRYRNLSAGELARYVQLEPALDCAGSAKCEGLGISLCEQVNASDPTALIGLPLIALVDLLRSAGLNPLAP